MDRFVTLLLQQFKPEFKGQEVGLSLNQGERIVYVNDALYQQLGYQQASEIHQLHPFMLSPELQPDGQLSSTKSILMMKTAKVLGEVNFPWRHIKADKTPVSCHIHLFDISHYPQAQVNQVDLFTIWQFNP